MYYVFKMFDLEKQCCTTEMHSEECNIHPKFIETILNYKFYKNNQDCFILIIAISENKEKINKFIKNIKNYDPNYHKDSTGQIKILEL